MRPGRYAPSGFAAAAAWLVALAVSSCSSSPASLEPQDSHARMVRTLAEIRDRTPDENPFLGDRDARLLRQRLAELPPDADAMARWKAHVELARSEIRLGNHEEAVHHFAEAHALLPSLAGKLEVEWFSYTTFRLALAHLRLGETENCVQRSTAQSCILPIEGDGIHERTEGSRQAIRYFGELLANMLPESSDAVRARWLLNIAYMTLGEWPAAVPKHLLIPPEVFASEQPFPRFENIASRLGLDGFNQSGGTAIEDFDGDGDLDLMISTISTAGELKFFVNEGDGSFTERAREAGLAGIFGGLNINHADYDNDGDADLLVLRGAWFGGAGLHPDSLLRNDGKGNFTDVSYDAGVGESRYPSQTGAWGDYDNDGDLDLYVGNEHMVKGGSYVAPSQLFRNDGDGTFTDVAPQAGVENMRFAKGVVWGDYDRDRWPDLYVSNLEGENRLYHNNGNGTFTDVAPELGLTLPLQSFPTWWWDFDNDGNLDLYVSSYRGEPGALASVARSYLGEPMNEELPSLYRGDGAGGFEEVSAARNLKRLILAMGANFGDLDNDGWLDFYLGTGYPDYEALVPNVMYRNDHGERFLDVTTAGGFGQLQKGHAIVFADLDQDGDQDVFSQLGGAFPGDAFHNALYLNPGFGTHSITLELVGTRSNRCAIGARIRVDVAGKGQSRSIYRHVGTGASFGSNPLRQTIGVGAAERVERVEVYWPTSDLTQSFEGLAVDRFYRIVEAENQTEELVRPRIAL